MNLKKTQAQHQDSNPLFFVQRIIVRWDKNSRGGPQAQERASIPEVFTFPLPAHITPSAKLLFHTVTYDFKRPSLNNSHMEETLSIGNGFPKRDGACIFFTHDDHAIQVDFHWNMWLGMPERNSQKRALYLKENEWGRISYNTRKSSGYLDYHETSYWWYEKHTYNIGFFPPESIQSALQKAPDQEYRNMAELR